MGEIADMMIDGEMCSLCGEYLGGGDGFSRLCAACQRGGGGTIEPPTNPYRCPVCGKAAKSRTWNGVRSHVRDAHAKRPDLQAVALEQVAAYEKERAHAPR